MSSCSLPSGAARNFSSPTWIDHDRPGVHRRACRSCGAQAARGGDLERAMRGEIDFEPALRARVALLKGLPAAVVDDVIENRIRLTPERVCWYPPAPQRAPTLPGTGGHAVHPKIAAMLGFDESRANKLPSMPMTGFTGEVYEPDLWARGQARNSWSLTRRLNLGARPVGVAERQLRDRSGGAWSGLSRKAQGRCRRRRVHKPRRSYRAPLRAGVSPQRIRRGDG